jgi:DNA polymerase kappa
MESSGEKPANNPKSQSVSDDDFETLKYQLLGPSLTKAGQDSVDQQKVRLAMLSSANVETVVS